MRRCIGCVSEAPRAPHSHYCRTCTVRSVYLSVTREVEPTAPCCKLQHLHSCTCIMQAMTANENGRGRGNFLLLAVLQREFLFSNEVHVQLHMQKRCSLVGGLTGAGAERKTHLRAKMCRGSGIAGMSDENYLVLC